jgi:glycosyltransferase involved in cell wall biosynthesis
MNPHVKVSVCVVTYNQVEYVRECLQSLIDQRTDFGIEIIVGDDCSTDGTREIVREFALRYPSIVVALLHEVNLGPAKNYLAVHGAASGEYVAHMDGDDYALPGKLAALVEVFDLNPSVNLAWHRMQILDVSTGLLYDDLIDTKLQPKGGFTRADLLACGSVGCHSASAYRRLPVNLQEDELLDYYVALRRIGEGRGMWLDGVYGVYRFGIGLLCNDGAKWRTRFLHTLASALESYPEHRRQVNALATLLVVADLKNFRAPLALPIWLSSLSLGGLIEFFMRLPIYKILRSPIR